MYSVHEPPTRRLGPDGARSALTLSSVSVVADQSVGGQTRPMVQNHGFAPVQARPAADDSRSKRTYATKELRLLDDFLAGSGISVDMLLCDSAQVANGKLFVLGGGLATVGPKPQPLALAFHISVPWDQADRQHTWRIDLFDEDGQPVTMKGKPLVLGGKFQPRRTKGLRPGTPLGVSMAINISPLPFDGGKGYAFGLSIDEATQPQWRVRFFVRS